MNKLYDRIDFVNNTVPALNETNLNALSKAVDDLDDRVILIAGDVLVTVPQLREMLEDCTELEARLEAMTENPPYIGENGHWYIWDTDTGAYVDSGIDASITVEIADITMLEPNATPYVTNTGTDTDPIFHLFIPRGQSGKGISSIAKTGTSGYVDTYTITYTDGTTTTYTVTNGRNTDQVSTIPTASAALVGTIYQYIGASTSSYTHGFYYECQNVNGSYQWVNIPVGNDPVEVSNSDPYIYRQGKGYLADIEIEGASVGWNQLVPNSGSDLSVTIPSGRKYIMKKNGTYTVGQSDGTALTGLTGGTDNVHDLSPMFGTTTIADAIYAMEQAAAGSGVAFFRKYFPKDYYAYDPGSIQSVCVGSRKVVGFNQWDEEWEVGSLNYTKTSPDFGKPLETSNQIRAKNYIPVLPNTTYYFYCGSSTAFAIGYDSSKNGIPSWGNNGYQGSGNTFTTPTNCYFVRFYCVAPYGTTYKNDICINLSDPSKNGTYEPYTSTAYTFDSTKQLRGMFTLVGGELKANGDVYTAGGNIQRKYGIVDLGTLTYNYRSDKNCFDITLTGLKDFAAGTIANMICSKYPTAQTTNYSNWGNNPDKTIFESSSETSKLVIKDSSYTDADTFKTAMSGVYLVYELATPTTETAQPYQNPQRAYIDGTEEFTDGLTRDVMIPVGNNSVYQQDKVLPSIEDYVDAIAGIKADMAVIAPIENGNTASTSIAQGKYFFHGGKFCKAKTAIASGATFTLGTNYEITTIADELFALNS